MLIHNNKKCKYQSNKLMTKVILLKLNNKLKRNMFKKIKIQRCKIIFKFSKTIYSYQILSKNYKINNINT